MQVFWMPYSELFWAALGFLIAGVFTAYLAGRLLPRWYYIVAGVLLPTGVLLVGYWAWRASDTIGLR